MSCSGQQKNSFITSLLYCPLPALVVENDVWGRHYVCSWRNITLTVKVFFWAIGEGKYHSQVCVCAHHARKEIIAMFRKILLHGNQVHNNWFYSHVCTPPPLPLLPPQHTHTCIHVATGVEYNRACRNRESSFSIINRRSSEINRRCITIMYIHCICCDEVIS